MKHAKLYLHPSTPIADAVIAAHETGQHIAGPGGRIRILPGTRNDQYQKALKIKALSALAHGVKQAHTL